MLKFVVFAALVLGVFGQDQCPDVSTLMCYGGLGKDEPVPDNCQVQETYIKLEDGTECTGCRFCLQSQVPLTRYCPPIACPMILPNCPVDQTYNQYFKILNGKTCRACESYTCA